SSPPAVPSPSALGAASFAPTTGRCGCTGSSDGLRSFSTDGRGIVELPIWRRVRCSLIASPLALCVHRGDGHERSGEEGGGGGYPLSIVATAERNPSDAIGLVRSVPALQFCAFLLGRRFRQHHAAGLPAVQGPGRSAARHLSYGRLFASDSVSEAIEKAQG